MASGRPTLSTKEVLDKLYKEWSGRENPNCTVSSLDEFLTKFHAELKVQFEIKESISKSFLKGKFVISTGRQHAFIYADIASGRLFFRVNPDESDELQIDKGAFYVVCGAFRTYLKETTKPGQTYSFAALAKSFDLGKLQLGRSGKQGLGLVGCSDTIARLIRDNFLLISYTQNTAANQTKEQNKKENKKDTSKPPKKSSNKENVDPEILLDRVWQSFRKYIQDMKEDQLPVYRHELEALYNSEFRLHKQTFDSKVKPDCEMVPFHKVVSKLKANRFLRFLGGEAGIKYIIPNQEVSKNQPKWKEPLQKRCPINVRTKNRRTKKIDVSMIDTSCFNREELAEDRNGVSINSVESEEEQSEFANREISEAETEKKYEEMIEGVVNFESVLISDKERKCKTIRIEFNPENPNQKMIFAQCDLIDNFDKVFSVGDRENVSQGKKEVEMYRGATYDINLYYRSKCIGFQTSILILFFKIGSEIFRIYRFLQGETRNSEMEEIFPTEPHIPNTGRNERVTKDVKVYEAPPFDSVSKAAVKKRLLLYRSPLDFDWFLKILEREVARRNAKDKDVDESKVWREICRDHWKYDVQPYLKSFEDELHQLLYFEELQWEFEMGRYDMKDVEMEKKAVQFSLLVPGLAENRPSLLPGDLATVSVQAQGDNRPGNIEYKGVITTIEAERILLDFHDSFREQFIKGQKHHVRFSFNRRMLRLMHRAIDEKHGLMKQRSFPSLKFNKKPIEENPLLDENALANMRVFDRKIESNEEQLTAVKNILQGSSRPYPYIVYGPPGTGKTVTCVEAMKQVLKLLPKSRILACAPSNYAADLILHRLLHPCPIPKNQLFRLNAQSRSVKTLPKEYNIEGFCKIVNGERFEIPSWEELEKYRVIICTMSTAGRLVCMEAPSEHFTHIFMDECGQATEPETYIPLAGLFDARNKNGGLVVMAGDPKQLGPVVQSPVARENGLETSLLERLMDSNRVYQRMPSMSESHKTKTSKLAASVPDDVCSPNSWIALVDEEDEREDSSTVAQANFDQPLQVERKGPYNPNYITKLLRNYRSHPSIIKIPNELFYDNELAAYADEFKINSLCQWEHLPTKGFPIIFHGVEGQDLQEGNSPSFFNPEEAAEVVNYVRMLLDGKGLGVSPAQIGVISPYRKQKQKIRKLLEKDLKQPGMSELKVGSVEEFQGDERRIIIISTNRCTVEYLKKDADFHLGFLINPKRFNVAITRAMALLIVVGNPFVLSTDKERQGAGAWHKFIEFCIEHGGYRGCVYTSDWKSKIQEQLNGRKQADLEDELGKWRNNRNKQPKGNKKPRK